VTLALGTRLTSSGSGGNVTPIDPPVERRVLVTDHSLEPIVLEFDPGDPVVYLVASEGTYDVMTLEGGTSPIGVTTEDLGRFILTVY
jgi:hypothetical protein